jgi:Dolichyl-phosphate-mannose-protein mannosyltransferase
VLRLWGLRQGLPYVYNVDEASNFVPTAVSFYFTGSWNPHYFINPPAFSYLLHVAFAFWFGGGWPFGAKHDVADAYATDPTATFAVARATAALLGTAAVGFVYLTGARLYDRRAGLLAGAVLATSFLAVFYSHLALNDVPALLPLTVSVYGSAGVLVHGRRRDYLIAGAALGFAAATKYTAGIVLLPLLIAAASRIARDSLERRAVLVGGAIAGTAALAAFLASNPHALLSFHEFWTGVRKQQETASGFGKLGLDHESGIRYYLWVLTWGLGWAPLAAAAAGAVAAFRRDLWLGLFLVGWPVVFTLYMGLQDRYFGRWLLPAVPALALLAGVGAVWVAELVATPSRQQAVLAALGVALVAQGLIYSVHVDRVLSRDDTRNIARDWMLVHVPGGSKIVVEPIVPDAWFTDAGGRDALLASVRDGGTSSGRRWIKFPTGRTTVDEQGRKRRGGKGRFVSVEDYERTLRPALVGSYARGGYCWVVIGSTQYGRALADRREVPRAIQYYVTLARRGQRVFAVTPYRPGKAAVKFSFDWSFDYYPLSYERPGPTVAVYRLDDASCKR